LIVGNLDLGVSSTSLNELGGLVAGAEYDQMDVSYDIGMAFVEGIAILRLPSDVLLAHQRT
jgi:hypothetical protein